MFFRVRMNNLSIRVFLGAVPIRIIEVLLYLDFENEANSLLFLIRCVCVCVHYYTAII